MKKESEQSIMLINRSTGELQKETVFGDAALRFIYETLLGRTLWGIAFHSAGLSEMLGRRYDSPASKKKIPALASTPGCNPEEAEFPPEHYKNFNAFFTRKLKPGARPFDAAPNLLSSPADGRLFVYENLKPTDPIPVKGAQRTLNDLCQEELPADSLASDPSGSGGLSPLSFPLRLRTKGKSGGHPRKISLRQPGRTCEKT